MNINYFEMRQNQTPLDVDNLPLSSNEIEFSDQEINSIEPSFEALLATTFAGNLLKNAIGFLGVSRTSNLPQVARFLQIFNLPTKQDGKWVPFCASGVSYSACKTYCDMYGVQYTSDNAVSVFKSVKHKVQSQYFLPSPSCGFIKEDAIKRKTFLNADVDKSLIKPGYLVLYSWTKSDWPDHIGIIEAANENTIHTVEFNTSGADNINGGCVSRRIRSYNCVNGFVKID